MSLFGDYIKERLNKDIIETNEGFLTFYPHLDGLYIEDLYVTPDARHNHVASKLADQVADIARQKGLKRLYGSVVPSANHSTSSLKVLLAYGFQLDSATNNFILLKKEVA